MDTTEKQSEQPRHPTPASEALGPMSAALSEMTPEQMAAQAEILGREPMEFWQDAICRQCQGPFKAFATEHLFKKGKPWVFTVICARCSAENRAKEEAEENRRKEDESLRKWKELCPQLYRITEEHGDTDESKLMSSNPIFAEILTRKYGRKGLLMRGDSGKCKTRIMWRLMRRYFDMGRSIRAFTAGSFERACRDAAGKFHLTEWFEDLAGVDCLFLDDLGKAPWSQTTTSTFFDILEARSSTRRPMFVTTNLSGDTLLQQLKLEKDIGEPMLRRLREFCELVVV